jgi:hypothetical protein
MSSSWFSRCLGHRIKKNSRNAGHIEPMSRL